MTNSFYCSLQSNQ